MILTRSRAYGAYLIIEVEGRIDGLTSSILNKTFEQAAEDGNHNLIVDFSSVSYISSAGLRVFLHVQKKLKPVGGEVILLSMQETALDVFRVSGLNNLFRIITELQELGESNSGLASESSSEKHFFSDDQVFHWEFRDVPGGRYNGIGNSAKLRTSSYTGKDIVTISQHELQFGLGLASVGESMRDYQSLFGESLLINHHFFGYPAVEMPSVDYAYYSKTHPGAVHFLYGFRFSGDFRLCLRFDSATPRDLLSIARKLAEICGRDFFGIVLAGKSAGIYGLNLKKIPWQDNVPDPSNIMHESNFAEWFDFPVEDTDLQKTVVAAGIYSKIADEEELHMHAAVFPKGLLGKSGMDVGAELHRIVEGAEPLKVLHLLEESRFFCGIAGIIIL